MLLLALFACTADSEPPAASTCPAPPRVVEGCGDLDCDGLADVVFAQTEDAAGSYVTHSTIHWGGDPTNTTALPTLGAADVAIADLDGDDWPDLVFANLSDGEVRTVDSYVYPGGPDGFSVATRIALPTVGASDVEVADVDGDGWRDLVFANRYDGGGVSVESYSIDVIVYLGGPDGFRADRSLAVPGFGAAQTAVADLDQDGWLDLAVANGTFFTDTSWVYLGGPDGWSVDRRVDLPTFAPEAVIAADLDGDTFPDLVFGNFYDNLALDIDSTIYWGGPEGPTPTNATAFPTHGATDLRAVDLVGEDGCPELVVANSMEGSFAALDFEAGSEVWALGFGARTPTSVTTLPTVSAAAVATGDLDGDGATDLVFANRYDPAGEAAGAVSYAYLGGDGGFDAARRVDFPVVAAAGVAVSGGRQ